MNAKLSHTDKVSAWGNAGKSIISATKLLPHEVSWIKYLVNEYMESKASGKWLRYRRYSDAYIGRVFSVGTEHIGYIRRDSHWVDILPEKPPFGWDMKPSK